MSKSSQMTEATNINAKTRPLPRKNFRILFIVQRRALQLALPLSLLTWSGERVETAAAEAGARPPPLLNLAGNSRPRGKSSAPTDCLSLSACVAFH